MGALAALYPLDVLSADDGLVQIFIRCGHAGMHQGTSWAPPHAACRMIHRVGRAGPGLRGP
jgi:hypothetical protein